MMNGIKTYSEVFAELPGAFRAEVDEALANAIDGLADSESGVEGATINVKLAIKRGRHGQIEIRPQQSTAVKRAPHLAAAWYVGPRGDLVSDDPRQEKLPLGPVRSIKGGA